MLPDLYGNFRIEQNPHLKETLSVAAYLQNHGLTSAIFFDGDGQAAIDNNSLYIVEWTENKSHDDSVQRPAAYIYAASTLQSVLLFLLQQPLPEETEIVSLRRRIEGLNARNQELTRDYLLERNRAEYLAGQFFNPEQPVNPSAIFTSAHYAALCKIEASINEGSDIADIVQHGVREQNALYNHHYSMVPETTFVELLRRCPPESQLGLAIARLADLHKSYVHDKTVPVGDVYEVHTDEHGNRYVAVKLTDPNARCYMVGTNLYSQPPLNEVETKTE